MADASALVELVLRTEHGTTIDRILSDPLSEVHIPALCDIEVASTFRRGLLDSSLTLDRYALALGAYLDLPLTRHGHRDLVVRILELRNNFTAYDATYVALAERLGASLLTADARLSNAARQHTGLQVLPG